MAVDPETAEPRVAVRRPPIGRRALALLPPVRCVWIILVGVAVLADLQLRGLGTSSLIAFVVVASILELALQAARFPGVRFPDAAIATALFLAFLLPPTVPLLAGGAVVAAAVAGRHLLRFGGRPILNPAASGMLLGALLFGMAPAWWAGLGRYGVEFLIVGGLLLAARSPGGWRLPAGFFAAFAPFTLLTRAVVGSIVSPQVLLLTVVDPSVLLLGLYMVAEPRTAPRDPRLYGAYAAMVGLGAALLPFVMPAIGTLVALVLVNAGVGVARWRSAHPQTANDSATVGRASARERRRRQRALREERRPAPADAGWSMGSRVAVGSLVLILLLALAALQGIGSTTTPSVDLGAPPGQHLGPGSGSTGGGGGSGLHTLTCTNDNPSIPSSTLSSLHQALGPSVILSYDSSTGTTVFYDPQNKVTVTETDLYEDYGFAEFNGDDYAVSGCHP